MEQNNQTLLTHGKKYNFLFDTSTILYFQKMYEYCGISIFTAIKECTEVDFFILNDVLLELMQGKKGINPTHLSLFLNHVLISESSMDRNRKENRFLIEEDGELKYVVLSSISATDYSQVLICQNHTQLVLVANDKKMLKSAAQVLKGRRTLGIPAFLDRLLLLYPHNEMLKELQKTSDKLFEKKHAFGNISEEKFNETIKIPK